VKNGEKWCPVARVVIRNTQFAPITSANRNEFGEPYPGTECIKSECAMWRWSGKEESGYFCGLRGDR